MVVPILKGDSQKGPVPNADVDFCTPPPHPKMNLYCSSIETS